jgi:acyl phosphate:glycerol-3-phosphate acyltransferase
MVNAFIAIVCGYLLGSIPSGYIAAQLKRKVDIRRVGSKNMGAVNVLYEVGTGAAILVLLADIGKGIGAILLARWLGVPLLFQLLTGLAAVIGHMFPIFLKFRGGKGGATTIGVLLCLMPRAVPFFLAIAVMALLTTRNISFCYSAAFICLPFVAWLIYHSIPMLIFSMVLPALVGVRHIHTVKNMRLATGGDWHKVIFRSSLKERI